MNIFGNSRTPESVQIRGHLCYIREDMEPFLKASTAEQISQFRLYENLESRIDMVIREILLKVGNANPHAKREYYREYAFAYRLKTLLHLSIGYLTPALVQLRAGADGLRPFAESSDGACFSSYRNLANLYRYQHDVLEAMRTSESYRDLEVNLGDQAQEALKNAQCFYNQSAGKKTETSEEEFCEMLLEHSDLYQKCRDEKLFSHYFNEHGLSLICRALKIDCTSPVAYKQLVVAYDRLGFSQLAAYMRTCFGWLIWEKGEIPPADVVAANLAVPYTAPVKLNQVFKKDCEVLRELFIGMCLYRSWSREVMMFDNMVTHTLARRPNSREIVMRFDSSILGRGGIFGPGEWIVEKTILGAPALAREQYEREHGFLTEAQGCPYVVQLHPSSFPKIVFPCYAKTLRDRLQEQPRLSPEAIRGIIANMAAALLYLHEANIIHCDFNLSNILLDEHEYPKIADFGSARRADEPIVGPVGKLGFQAPEVAEASPEAPLLASAALDLFSFSLNFYCMIEHQVFAWPMMTASNVQNNFRKEIRPNLDNSDSARLIQRLWSHTPAQRGKTQELIDGLRQLNANEDTSIISPAF